MDFKTPIWDIINGLMHLSSTFGLDPINAVNVQPNIVRNEDNSTDIELSIHEVEPESCNVTITDHILTVSHVSFRQMGGLTVKRKVHEEFYIPKDVNDKEIAWRMHSNHLIVYVPPSRQYYAW
ncbi:unnamed protein product [Bursaphelenchus okinawaensis]|uniref:SHSP domain-containing protein n=1 Tax=Bursaphelenchus okinawaensis TaxID=465554 RepID=A0A811KE09_9BILA|nr:unnamed protein product [Bursaphelenchus okinawaensis]CAG9101993.1 unnamed protein product [Bursaphelenchus okinawaensis]